MTVSMVFEVHATEDEPCRALLEEIDGLPHWERELMISRIMRWEADRRAECAAAAIALRDHEARRADRARLTRERNRADKETTNA